MSRGGPGVWAGAVLVLLAGCATSGPRHYAQSLDSATSSCSRNPACYTQTGNEAALPWVARAADAARAGVAVMKFLEAADVKRVEQLLVQCAEDANAQVNEEVFGRGKRPTAEQCNEVVRREQGQDVTRAMELGRKKHEVALDCVKRGLGEAFARNVTLQPRYKYDPQAGRWRMLSPELVAKWLADGLFELLRGTLSPDVVVHATGNPDKVQRVYDYKFPCLLSRRAGPGWRYSSQKGPDQREKYKDALGGEDGPFLITPQLGIQR